MLNRVGGTSCPAGICVVSGPPFKSSGGVSELPEADSGAAALLAVPVPEAACGGVAALAPYAADAFAAALFVPAAPAVPVTAPAGAPAAVPSTSSYFGSGASSP